MYTPIELCNSFSLLTKKVLYSSPGPGAGVPCSSMFIKENS